MFFHASSPVVYRPKGGLVLQQGRSQRIYTGTEVRFWDFLERHRE